MGPPDTVMDEIIKTVLFIAALPAILVGLAIDAVRGRCTHDPR
jgi:hypothetical protein